LEKNEINIPRSKLLEMVRIGIRIRVGATVRLSVSRCNGGLVISCCRADAYCVTRNIARYSIGLPINVQSITHNLTDYIKGR